MNRFYSILFFVVLSIGSSAQIKMEKTDAGILFTEKGKNVLFYQMEPKNKKAEYERCNYFHPIWADDGTVLTEDFPADHLHHRGVFWAWHQVWIGDKRIGDPWELKSFEQKVTEVEFIAQQNGSALLETEVEWKSDKWIINGSKQPYLKENASILIHPKNGNYRKIDIKISLLALEENLKIGGSEDVKGYSGFSVRMKLPGDIKFEGKNGIVEPQNAAVASPGYINVSGSLMENGSKGGVVIVDNSENTGYPQSWILRKKNSMQNAAFPGNKVISVSTKKPLVLKYSMIVYSGKMSNKKIEKIIN